MKVIAMSRQPFNITTHENVTKIEYSNGIYTVYVGATSYTYNETLFIVRMV